jgi:hypothetical protein
LEEDSGTYHLYATEDDERVMSYVITGFWLNPAWLWNADQYTPIQCIAQMEGATEAIQAQLE